MKPSTYLPNASDALAVTPVELADGVVNHQPMRFIQIFGGKRWSLSICIKRGPIRRASSNPAPSRDLSYRDCDCYTVCRSCEGRGCQLCGDSGATICLMHPDGPRL